MDILDCSSIVRLKSNARRAWRLLCSVCYYSNPQPMTIFVLLVLYDGGSFNTPKCTVARLPEHSLLRHVTQTDSRTEEGHEARRNEEAKYCWAVPNPQKNYFTRRRAEALKRSLLITTDYKSLRGSYKIGSWRLNRRMTTTKYWASRERRQKMK